MLASIHQFADCSIDPAALEVHCDGELVVLSPKVFDCLAYLIEHRERAVGRDELISAVWGRADVSDTLLGQTSWPRPDAQERKQAMVQQMMQNVQRKTGEKIKLNARAMTSNFTVSVDLKESKATAANFVPRKLSEEELQKKIAQANEETNKRLTDEQKKSLGEHGMGDMVGGLIRKSNERVEVDGVGEAPYWLQTMGGSLSVLAGGYQPTISPMLADDEAGNVEAAR